MNDNVAMENNSEIKVVYLAAEDLKLAASLLYQSYHDDPVFFNIFKGDKEGYEQRFRAAIREELSAFWHAKQPMIGLYLGDAMVGVVCLNSPEESITSDRFWHWRLKMLLSAGYFSTKQMIEKEKIIASAIPLNKYHMLSFIAIHPLHQHHGFAQYLLAAVNTVLDEDPDSEGVVVYATSDKYRSFFQDVNYNVITPVTVGNVTGTLMVHYRDD